MVQLSGELKFVLNPDLATAKTDPFALVLIGKEETIISAYTLTYEGATALRNMIDEGLKVVDLQRVSSLPTVPTIDPSDHSRG